MNNMSDRRIIEPCPFCGAKGKEIQLVVFEDGMSKIRCPRCKVTFEGMWSRQEIINKWNERYRERMH